jgi:probable rRNA maturation factor
MCKNVEITNNTDANIDHRMFQTVYEAVKNGENLQKDKTIDLIFCKSDAMQSINKKYRGADKPTDVLSFACDFAESISWGEIIIDVETAEMQRCDKTLNRELQELFLHGFLHILGYDHIKTKDKDVMTHKENKYLQAL